MAALNLTCRRCDYINGERATIVAKCLSSGALLEKLQVGEDANAGLTDRARYGHAAEDAYHSGG